MIPDTLETTLAELQQALTDLGDPGDVLLTYNAQAEFARKQSILMNAQRVIRESRSILAEVEPLIATLTTWRDHLVTWRQTLEEQLAATGPQDRRRYGLELSVERIDRGLDLVNEAYPANIVLDDLMREAGYQPRDLVARANGECWLGTLAYTEQRLRELRPRRDDARDRLDAVLSEYDAKRDMTSAG